MRRIAGDTNDTRTRTDGTGGDTGVIAAAGTIDPTDHQEEGKTTVAEREMSVALPVDELQVKSEVTTGGSLGDTTKIVGGMITSGEETQVESAVTTDHITAPEEIAPGAQDQRVLVGRSGVDHTRGRGGGAEALMIEEEVKVLYRDCFT